MSPLQLGHSRVKFDDGGVPAQRGMGPRPQGAVDLAGGGPKYKHDGSRPLSFKS